MHHPACVAQVQFKEMEPEDQLLAASTPAEVRAAKKAMAAKEAAKAAADRAAADQAAAAVAATKQPLHEVQEQEPSHKDRKRRTKSRWGMHVRPLVLFVDAQLKGICTSLTWGGAGSNRQDSCTACSNKLRHLDWL